MRSNKSKQDERRNYYRILNVQPDAPIEIIKNNYRTLLQKLRLHPDLGGEDWNASVINEAYNVLRNSEKRAVYDKELLKRYELQSLSRGHLANSPNANFESIVHEKDQHGNQRNFYRLFNIQSDSPEHIIKTTYLTLSKNSDIPKELLNEAYSILGNAEKRALYDRLISKYSHADTVKKLSLRNQDSQQKTSNINAYITNPSIPAHLNRTNVNKKYSSSNKAYYQPVITQYCVFCKTPHAQSPCRDTAPLCNECKSPLFPPSEAFLEQARRDIVRIEKDNHINFYTYWPGKRKLGTIADMSPTGIQLLSSSKLTKDQVIKLDGEDFKALGIVSYQNDDDSQKTTGIRFLTVNFSKQKGHFFSESA